MARIFVTAALVVAGFGTASGCGSRLPSVDLEAPESSAPAAERAEAYDALAIRNQERCGAATCFRLGDGRYIYRIHDLEAVLDPKTPTARALRSARRLEVTGRGIAAISLAAWTTGVVYMVRGALDEEARFGRAFWLGAGLWAGSHLGYAGLFAMEGMAASRYQRARDAYNDSLRESLGL